VPAPAAPAGGGRGGRGGGGGGGGGRGGPGGGAAGVAAASAVQGLNKVTWSNPRLTTPFQIPPRTIMWGGGSQAPKAAPGTYTVKVSSGSWSQTQTFHLAADPRYVPAMTDAEGAAQLKLALEVGGWLKQLYDNLAKIRDAKQQAADSASKAGAQSGAMAAARTLTDKLVAVEGDLTQMQGEASQDSLNFPGRFDNQLVALYSNIVGLERKLNTAVTERYNDIRPQFDALMERAGTALKADVDAFNAAAARAGAATITIK